MPQLSVDFDGMETNYTKLMNLKLQRYRRILFSVFLHPKYRDHIMPESPEVKVANQSSTSPTVINNTPGRPLSTCSSMSGMNGTHSPLSVLNGRTPSPHGMSNSATSQQLPPACGARQLSKLKRFLTTLQQFGADISPEIGERVRNLVLGLVNSHLSIEEFHCKLQEATNFPLRPFVIPFLKANLPLLQRELLHCARLAKQSPQHYLAHNEQLLFDAGHTSPNDTHNSVNDEINENGKRRSPERPKENGLDLDPPPCKRPHPLSPHALPRISPSGGLGLASGGAIRLEDISLSREIRERERLERDRTERERLDRERERERERDRLLPGYGGFSRDPCEPLDRLDDDWKHIENMLHCIVGMVEKTKRALAVIQERSVRDREELSVWMRRHSADGLDGDLKKRHNVLVAQTLRQSEDRVSEVKRRAEEAVAEVKRQAVLELQKAVGAAEQKATELISSERCKMEKTINDTRKTIREEVLSTVNHQEESSESCWNCGRKASETCSGCNVARYCGSFCQHKDWENHHHVCGKHGKAVVKPSVSGAPDRSSVPGMEKVLSPKGGKTSVSGETNLAKSPQMPVTDVTVTTHVAVSSNTQHMVSPLGSPEKSGILSPSPSSSAQSGARSSPSSLMAQSGARSTSPRESKSPNTGPLSQ